MVAALPKPKRGSTPKAFYLEYLPELWRALVGDGAVDMDDIAVSVHLGGGERYVCAIEDGRLIVRSGEHTEALAVFTSDVDSWRITVLELTSRLLKRTEGHTLNIADRLATLELGALRACPGSITVVYEDDAGDASTVTIAIAGGGHRKARIEASDTELWRLLDGGAKLSQLVTSRVRVSGDVAYVIELARLFEP